MRKCGACGYLLFGYGETCNHCGEAVPAVAVKVGSAAAGATAWPPVAPNTPASAAPNARAPASEPSAPNVWRGPSFSAPAPTPTAAAPQPAADFWRPVAMPPAAPPKTKFPAGLVLGIVAALVVGALAFTFVTKQRNALPGGTSDFVAGNGVSYTAADGSYTAQFPETPTVQSQAVPVGNSSIQVSLASVTTNSYEMGSASLDFRVRVPQDRVATVLDEALNGGVAKANGDLVYKHQITRGGLPAVDAKFKAPDGYSAHVLVMLKQSRVYVLFVHAKTGTDKLFRAFDQSFLPQ